MTQNSLSPVVKSRISSSSGRTINVENRSLARTGTISSLEYLTTRAPSVAACAGRPWIGATPRTRSRRTQVRLLCRRMRMVCFIGLLLLELFGVVLNLVCNRGRSASVGRSRPKAFPRLRAVRPDIGDTATRPPARGVAATLRGSELLARTLPRENFEAFFEAIGIESLFAFLVVVRVVGVEPVTFRIDVQVCNLGELRRLN